jgi:hypothetical protein
MTNFKEDIETIIAHYQEVLKEAVAQAGDVRAVDHTRTKIRHEPGHVMLWTAPTNADDEAAQIERTVHNMATLTRARNIARWMVQKYGEGSDGLRKARRQAALEEVGRSPVEVALLYGYSNSHKVRELRVRHGRNAEDGTVSRKPITSREA